jgi:hypothetical protein
MINKKLDETTIDDLRYLVENNVQERKTLEYKKELPDNTDGGKKEFLGDISSLANTLGGDLVFGIQENDSVLQDELGIEIDNIDAEMARLENIIRDGLSPRIDVDIKCIDVEDGKKVLVLRTKASIESPHRVIFKGNDKFYKRNTNGKYPIDVNELRTAFIQASDIVDRIKRFRVTRIIDIKSGETPYPIREHSSFIALHIIPLSAFTTSFRLDSETLLSLREGKYSSFAPLFHHGWSHRINLDGIVAYCADKKKIAETYSQLYRNGIFEAVESRIITRKRESEEKVLPMYPIEDEVMKYGSKVMNLLSQLEIQPPFYVFLTLSGIKGFTVSAPNDYSVLETDLITQKDLLLPEIIFENTNENIQHKFRPVFDMIWNAGGVSKSLSFDEEGNFKKQS